MALTVLALGVMLAIAILATVVKVTSNTARFAIVGTGLTVLALSVVLASVRYVPASKVGIVTRNAFGSPLTEGRIIASKGEMGVQAQVLSPGWHTGYWPGIFDIDIVPLIEVPSGQVGLVTSRDGDPLDPGQVFAPEVEPTEFKKMVNDASYFLAKGGRKGQQSNVLTPGKYRLNTALFEVEMVSQTDVPKATVAVLKSNSGREASVEVGTGPEGRPVILAGPGEKGIRAEFLTEGIYPINTNAIEVITVSTAPRIVRYTTDQARTGNANLEEKPIEVRTLDGFTFPVDVRVRYRIEKANAPTIIAGIGDDRENLLDNLNSAVRAIFRNNAGTVKAIDYVNERNQQEEKSREMLTKEMEKIGVTIEAVFIGDVGNEETLGDLLKTQRDREIAVQEQQTFQEQQKAAEQKKELTRTEQEAEEEKRLATANYQVQIAEQEKQKRVIEAEAQAEAITIEAEARSKAFQLVAEQIGQGNAALIELLTIIGENAIEITPRVMVNNSGASANSQPGSAESVALIGTMLDSMVDKTPGNTSSPRRPSQTESQEGSQN